MQEELPKECERELDYPALIETLALLEGEEVSLSILGLSSPGGESPRIKVVGELRKIGYSGVDGFAVGDSGRVLLHGPARG